MNHHTTVPVIAIGLFLRTAFGQDRLTPSLDADLTSEWSLSFGTCARALQYHGEGKDDRALEVLSSRAPTPAAKEHYKIAESRPKDAFWKKVATAGAPAIDCENTLSNMLDLHFYWRPEDLRKADDDAATSNFLALSDLLLKVPIDGFAAIPAGAAVPALPAQSHDNVANAYRFCFSDADSLFAAIKTKLGR
jgi:hypothetical protein